MSDVKAKLAYKEELETRGYEDVRVISKPADISATKAGENFFFEIKMTQVRGRPYFGATSLTEWVAAVEDPEHYAFVIAETNEAEEEWKFTELTVEEMKEISTFPPPKTFFTWSDKAIRKPKRRNETVPVTEENIEAVAKTYRELSRPSQSEED